MILSNANIEFAHLPYFLGACVFLLLVVRLLLLDSDSQTQQANRYLILLFAIFSLLELDEFFSLVIDNWALPVGLNYTMYAAHLLLGPLTYLYASNMLKPEQSGYRNLIHFVPFALMLIIAFNADKVAQNETAERLLFVSFITLYLATLLPYILMSLKILNRYIGESKNLFSDLQNHNLNWVRFWLFFMLFLALYVVINPLLKWLKLIEHNPFEIHYFLAAAGLILLVWPRSSQQQAINADLLENTKSSDLNAESIEDSTVNLVFTEITSAIESQKCYLQNGLTLSDISQLTGFSNEDISKAINTAGGACFYDFINAYRIEESKRLLVEFKSRAIIDIAMDAGFNSKSAFYTAFKKRLNQTPSEYRATANIQALAS